LQRVFSVNLHGAWLMTRAVVPTMVEKRYGRIINQSSEAAYMYSMVPEGPFEGLSAFTYSQTKWGVIGLTKFLAGQLGQYNVTVNCITPGVTMTEATKKIVPEDIISIIRMMSAMKRTLEAEDLTGSALFFASDDANLVTGQVLCVGGGSQRAVARLVGLGGGEDEVPTAAVELDQDAVGRVGEVDLAE